MYGQKDLGSQSLGNADQIAESDLACIFMQCFVITRLK